MSDTAVSNAPSLSGASLSPRDPALLERLDPSTRMRVRLAAQIGETSGDETFVSFTSLLIALLHEREGLSGLVNVDRILSARRTDAKQVASSWEGLRGSREDTLTWPSGRPLLSTSARNVLATTAEQTPSVIGTQDLIRTYLYNVPRDHQKQMEEWGFASDRIPEIAKVLGVLPDARPAGADGQPSGGGTVQQPLVAGALLPGFDTDASAILLVGRMLARRRTRTETPPNTASTLLVALVEAPSFLTLLPPELSDLRANVGADNTASTYTRYRTSTYTALPEPSELSSEATLTPPAQSDALRLICEEAQAIAQQTTGQTLASPRHLLAALIVKRDGRHNADADRLSKDRGLNAEQLRTQLLKIVRSSYPSDVGPAWTRLLEGARTVATVQADTIPDDPRKQDALDLRRYADAIAALSSAREQQPPLSIAVFGAWGSGKSFFMAMVRSGVKECEALGKTDPTFLSRIVQVQFNAWHYVEGNLWASLVHAILEQLQHEIAPPGKEKELDKYLAELSIRKAAEQEAGERLRKAREQVEDAKAALDRAEEVAKERKDKEEKCAVKAQDFIQAFRAEALEKLAPAGPNAKPDEWVKSVGAKLREATQYLGLTGLDEQLSALVNKTQEADAALKVPIGAVEDVLEAAKANAQRSGALLTWLTHSRMSKDDLVLLGMWAGGLFVGLLVLTGILELAGAHIVAVFTGIAALLGSGGAAITGVARWSQRVLAHASGVFDWLESLRVRIGAERKQRLSVSNAELIAAQREAAAATTEVQRLQAEHEAAVRAAKQAEEEALAATSPEQLKRFVAERLAAGDYLRHLGLLHTVRGDMEKLGTMLSPSGQAKVLAGGETPVQRIILYIDDLDRCPPPRVVEVLEAVHLLLAFPLFVVIVGVDIRWVQQALCDRYPKQLGQGEGIASAMDYLEKVFQIPFWLPALDSAGGVRLLEAAIGPVEPAAQEDPPETSATGSAGSGPPPPPADVGAQQQTETPGGERKAEPKPVQGDAADAPPPITLTAEALMLTAAEAAFLKKLTGVVSISPRRTKRFANLYRVLKGSLSPVERRRLTYPTESGGQFRSPLFLLALLTGAPKATSQLIDKLKTPPSPPATGASAKPLDDLLKSIQPPPEEAGAFKAAIDLIATDPLEADALENLRHWAGEVYRFAFSE